MNAKPDINEILAMTGRKSIYQPEQQGLIYPEEPQFDSFEEARTHLKQRLVAACRAFALHGLDYGFAGHLTIRDPEHPSLYWTNPMAVHFADVKVSNLILDALIETNGVPGMGAAVSYGLPGIVPAAWREAAEAGVRSAAEELGLS